jgi:hypothetical protein
MRLDAHQLQHPRHPSSSAPFLAFGTCAMFGLKCVARQLAGDVWQLIVAYPEALHRTGTIFEKAGVPIDASVALEKLDLQTLLS